jgi:hypothetical protein
MQERRWYALGEELRALRMARDLSQPEVVDRSGEKMTDRGYRGYELGEQRPGRDRLLRFLLKSFELKDPSEINRVLHLAHYAGLSDSDIEQFGLGATTVTSHARSSRTGRPVDFRIEASTLIATDGEGREVWRHTFPSRLFHSAYDQQTAIKRCTFGDIDNDGRVETLFVYLPIDFQSVGATLICFGEDGAVRWQFVPGKAVTDSTGREYFPPYFISNVSIVPLERLGARVLVSSNHYLHNPNQIAMLAPNGDLVSEYWHSGHLLSVAHADLNADGIREILLAGVNNGYGQATLVIFDPRNVRGASTQPGRQILNFPAGTEKVVVLFPKTCLSKDAPYNRVSELRVTPERRIMLAVVEGISEAKNPGVMIYELDFALNVLNARPDSHLQENHRILEAHGVLDHSWTEDENREIKRRVVIHGKL